MRAAGKTYLPQHTEETDKAYQERLLKTYLHNGVEQTLDDMVGRPFGEPVQHSDDFSEGILELMEDIDLQGNNIDVFAREWFRGGVSKAMCHVYIDQPRLDQPEEGQTRTKADDERQNVRPYWTLIQPEQIIFAQVEVVNGVETLLQLRIHEIYCEMDGFVEVFKERIKVIYPGRVEVWIPKETKKQKKEWMKSEEYTYGLDIIPLVTFYANKEAPFIGKPPLLDLADINIAHWQSTSDQRVILTVSRFPILAMTGVEKQDDQVRVGPHEYLWSKNANAKFMYVEHSGAGIEAGRNDLKDLEEQMESYGADLLKKRPVQRTAKEVASDDEKETSPLQDMAQRFNSALIQAVEITARWMSGVEVTGQIFISTDFDDAAASSDITEIGKARERGDISRKSYITEMKRRGVFDEDFDEEADEAELEAEITKMMGRSDVNLNPDDDEGDDE